MYCKDYGILVAIGKILSKIGILSDKQYQKFIYKTIDKIYKEFTLMSKQ